MHIKWFKLARAIIGMPWSPKLDRKERPVCTKNFLRHQIQKSLNLCINPWNHFVKVLPTSSIYTFWFYYPESPR